MSNVNRIHPSDVEALRESLGELMSAIFEGGNDEDDNDARRNPVEDVLRLRLLGPDGYNNIGTFEKADAKKKENIAVNIKEDDTAYHITAMMPGVKKEDIKVSISDKNDLTISVEVKVDKTEKTDNYVKHEISDEKKERVIHFEDEIDRDKVSASLENGMLNITLAKVDQSALVKRIEIK